MTAFARFSSTTGIASAIYAWLTKSPSISKLTSWTSFSALCSAVTQMAVMPAGSVPAASMSIASPSPARPASAPPAESHSRFWVNNITKDILEVPHLHITLTTDDSFRPFFRGDSQLLNELLRIGAQAVLEVISDLYPGMRIGLIDTVHTAGGDLGYKPHVHLIITKGGFVDSKLVEIECIRKEIVFPQSCATCFVNGFGIYAPPILPCNR